ncbi:hypothetical protein N5923_21625 [Erwiniaceae bacterium BAC15a-03b]|uniref:Lipoprotein n=1 Tax=Winslowiella arboricola TaxID=2978220 RepID=A0A9J6Q1G6_9GAMM|nr:hypothetical protein [Winslowiella arboricola]MCU5774753.1 hypothetical protein [Winslowiella arboricola]MCU5780095.1 hypothetical protein [Winslowiella arboricola]
MGLKFMVALVAILLSGCALKQYPQSPQLSAEESAALDCPAIEREIASSHSVQQEISRTGSFDALTVVGFIGDFGIGNGIAKYRANDKASDRLNQLESLKATRCPLTG